MTDYAPMARRTALGALTVAAGLGRARLGFARAATEQRFVVVLLRGGLDGLATVVPYGDRSLMGIRAPLVPPPVGSGNGMLDLGGFYGLHPALSRLHGLYWAGEILAVQAVAGPYRSRSHFEAQDFMEAGAGHRVPSGWLNRVAGKLLPSGELDAAIALGAAVPPLLRGPVPVGNWAPRIWPAATPDLYARLIALHRRDPVTGFTVLADRAGRLLAAPEGPRLPRSKSTVGTRMAIRPCGWVGSFAGSTTVCWRCGTRWVRPGARRLCWS